MALLLVGTLIPSLEHNGDRQEKTIKKRTVTSMKFVKLLPNRRQYAAFVDVEAWGKDAK